jgi:redox-sensitive bicupin YhaK (pirin superfamily)
LFCVHHHDAYPAGNDRMGPATSLAGRDIGQDFAGKDGWRMYHGDVVPGFPAHPHRGFETITIVTQGVVDHSDSLGATARFGGGDVQWLTAGKGIVHAEMFPLRSTSEANPLELFQIWLNLPSTSKMAEPHFSMLWRHEIPEVAIDDAAGGRATVRVVAGTWGDAKAPPPPPASWASTAEADLAIWMIRIDPGASVVLPVAGPQTARTLYVVRGDGVAVGTHRVAARHGALLDATRAITVGNPSASAAELLVLQGRPIGEPVAQQGPFVMNTRAQLEQAFSDYRRTRFGGWPWPVDGPVHARDEDRFAQHADGRIERPTR